jgi:hypothetical protein
MDNVQIIELQVYLAKVHLHLNRLFRHTRNNALNGIYQCNNFWFIRLTRTLSDESQISLI